MKNKLAKLKEAKPGIIILVAIIVALLMGQFKPRSLESAQPDQGVAVTTETLQLTQVDLTVKSQGTVLPRTRTNLISEVSGLVVEVAPQFVVGGTFAKGDILIRLDSTDYEVAKQRADAMLISAKAQLLSEQARSAQAKKEWQMSGRPLEEAPVLALRAPFLAEAESRLLQAEAEVKQAELKLQRTLIRAPYRGMVSVKSVDVGQYVTIGARLGETFAIDFAEVRLPMTAKDLSMLGPITYPGEQQEAPRSVLLRGSVNGELSTWQAKLVRSEGTVEQKNRTQYLVAQVNDPYNTQQDPDTLPLLMGTFVEAQVAGRTIDKVYALPRHALRSGNRVATLDSEQRLDLKKVEFAFEDQSYYYLNAGLEGVVEVVTSSLGVMVQGMKLNPKNNLQSDAS